MMMGFEGILVVFASFASLIYLGFEDMNKKNEVIGKKYKAFIADKRRTAYVILSCLALIGLVIMLNITYKNNHHVTNLRLLSLAAVLFPIGWVDYKKHIIPNSILLLSLSIRLGLWVAEAFIYQGLFFGIIKDNLYAFVLVVIFLVFGLLFIRNGMGMGDVKLLLIMACYQGLTGIVSSLFFSLLIAFGASVYLLCSKKKKRKDTIPFAPFILVGTYISIFLTGA